MSLSVNDGGHVGCAATPHWVGHATVTFKGLWDLVLAKEPEQHQWSTVDGVEVWVVKGLLEVVPPPPSQYNIENCGLLIIVFVESVWILNAGSKSYWRKNFCALGPSGMLYPARGSLWSSIIIYSILYHSTNAHLTNSIYFLILLLQCTDLIYGVLY
jgi:hypothetical protein